MFVTFVMFLTASKYCGSGPKIDLAVVDVVVILVLVSELYLHEFKIMSKIHRPISGL